MNEYEKILREAPIHKVFKKKNSALGIEEFWTMEMLMDDGKTISMTEIIAQLKRVAEDDSAIQSIPKRALPEYAKLMEGVSGIKINEKNNISSFNSWLN